MATGKFHTLTAYTADELNTKVNDILQQGGELVGAPFTYTERPGLSVTLAQAVLQNDSGSASGGTSTEPEYYYVVVLSGQSNGMAYGEGIPLPETYDRPDSRIKQLARRSTVTPGGDACAYNDVIQADHCLHDVQDMSGYNHPKADLTKGQYGCVGQGLHIAKKLLPFIPANAGILLVPCCRGDSAFTSGAAGSFSESSGATSASGCWQTGAALYQDMVFRTKAALACNPDNVLLAVVWMQGEADLKSSSYTQQPTLFTAMVSKFRSDLGAYAGQCTGGSVSSVPWICGDTTYYWKNTYATQYEAVYGAYKNLSDQNIFFVPFMTDENGNNTPTNLPAEDPDIVAVGYYGAESRTEGNLVSTQRDSHFSSWARRGIISDRLASAILTYAGRTTDFISGEMPDATGAVSGEVGSTGADTSTDTGTGTGTDEGTTSASNITLSADAGELSAQGWTVDGTTVTATANTLVPDGETLAQKVFSIDGATSNVWTLTHPATSGSDLLTDGGEFFCRFRITSAEAVANRYALGLYWLLPSAPDGVTFNRSGSGMTPALLNLYVQTDSSGNMNLCMHCKKGNSANLTMKTIGAFDNNWHTISLVYKGGGTARANLTVDGTEVGDLTLTCTPSTVAADTLMLSAITAGTTYNIEVESLSVTVNDAAEAA
ncbi:sialate O-acetylesterase [Escherichia coli]|nr:sialate O-acetylesterase [Escherichia coli]